MQHRKAREEKVFKCTAVVEQSAEMMSQVHAFRVRAAALRW